MVLPSLDWPGVSATSSSAGSPTPAPYAPPPTTSQVAPAYAAEVVIRVGISGWTYKPWRGDFYPPGLRQREELAFVAERMNSVEINGSFYSLQRRSATQSWAAAVPDDFEFAVKGGRFITHMKKLSEIETPLANFLASGVLALGTKLGPMLWQLPPNLGFDAERMERVPHRSAADRRRGRPRSPPAGTTGCRTTGPS